MRRISTLLPDAPPRFAQFPIASDCYDLIVHASIPEIVTRPRRVWTASATTEHDVPYGPALVTAGAGQMRLGGQTWPLRPGSLILLGPRCQPWLTPLPNQPLRLLPFSFHVRHPITRHDYLDTVAAVLSHWSGEALASPAGPLPLDDVQANRYHELILSLNSQVLPDHQANRFALYAGAFELLAFLVVLLDDDRPAATSVEPRLVRVRREIERHFDQPLLLDDLARLAGLSRYYLCRRFKAAYGLAPQQYQQHVQLRAACNHLRTTGDRVQEIAAAVGFASPEHFCRLFRKRVGLSPLAYRRQRPSTDL
jgi:AraC-like DNA-binding protein